MIYDTKNIITWFLTSLEIIPIKETLIWLYKNRGIYLPILENKVIHNIVTMYHFFFLDEKQCITLSCFMCVIDFFYIVQKIVPSKFTKLQITCSLVFFGWIMNGDNVGLLAWFSYYSLFFSHTTYRWNELGLVKTSYRQVDKSDLLDSILAHVATCVGKRLKKKLA